MKRYFITILIVLCSITHSSAQSTRKPKLIVKIIVGQFRESYIDKYSENLSADGFLKLVNEGASFSEARYDFMQTITPATLSTFTTGTNPSSHGVVTEHWIDYVNNKTISLIDDEQVKGLDCDEGIGQYSPLNLTVPTLGDMLINESPKSQVVTIASSPLSSIVMGGNSSNVFWIDDSRFNWISSSAYMEELPQWVNKYNELRVATDFLDKKWELSKSSSSYVNRTEDEVKVNIFSDQYEKLKEILKFNKKISREYSKILLTPVANTLVAEFAKQALVHNGLGQDEDTDILNICFDTPRYISRIYGNNSVEFEDMLYRLDRDIADLVEFISIQVGLENVLFLFTADHGSSDPQSEKRQNLFNTSQFKVILNSFLGSQYGEGDWVVGYFNRQIYLNRNLIYQKNLDIEEVQNRAAAFSLQFRGVSHVLTATAMQSSYFADSYAQMIQNSFYPKRGGDLTINLMPGWIEQDSGAKILSGSMYDYDTYVPLILYGFGISPATINTPVDMKDIAPTLAKLMQINKPIASTGAAIQPMITLFK